MPSRRDQYIEDVLKPGSSLLALQETVLGTTPNDLETWTRLCKQAKEFRQAFSVGMIEVIGSSGMLSLEISYGRIGARDLKLLIEKAKMLSGRLLGLASFQVSGTLLWGTRLIQRLLAARPRVQPLQNSATGRCP